MAYGRCWIAVVLDDVGAARRRADDPRVVLLVVAAAAAVVMLVVTRARPGFLCAGTTGQIREQPMATTKTELVPKILGNFLFKN